jgi:hypothetical protein
LVLPDIYYCQYVVSSQAYHCAQQQLWPIRWVAARETSQ